MPLFAIFVAAATLMLAGCDSDRTEYPSFVCTQRDTFSGKCVEGRYWCATPLKLTPYNGGAICKWEKDDARPAD